MIRRDLIKNSLGILAMAGPGSGMMGIIQQISRFGVGQRVLGGSGGGSGTPYGSQVSVSGLTNLLLYGDSITTIGFAPTRPYCNSLEAALEAHTSTSWTQHNQSLSGQGVPYMTKKSNQNYISDCLITTLCGRNDITFWQAYSTNLVNYYKWGHATILGNQFAGTYFKAADSTISGSWSALDKTNYSAKYADAQKTTSAGSLTFTISGTDFVVSMLGAHIHGVNKGRFKIKVDGSYLYDIVGSDNVYEWDAGGYEGYETSMGFPVLGLSSGSHTIIIEWVSGQICCDYVVALKDSTTCKPVIISNYVNTVAWTGSPNTTLLTNMTAALSGIVDDFNDRGYPAVFVDNNTFWGPPPTDVLGDNTHLDDNGNDGLTDAFMSKVI